MDFFQIQGINGAKGVHYLSFWGFCCGKIAPFT